MSATQGVILIMLGVLILYLVWAAKSPLNVQAPADGGASNAPPASEGGNGESRQ